MAGSTVRSMSGLGVMVSSVLLGLSSESVLISYPVALEEEESSR